MSYWEQVVLSGFDAVETAIVLSNLFGIGFFRKSKARNSLILVSMIVAISLVAFNMNHSSTFLINAVIVIISFRVIFDEKIGKVIIGFTISSMIFIPAQMLIAVIVSPFLKGNIYGFNAGLIVHIVMLTVIVLINRFIKLGFVFNQRLYDNKYVRYLSLNVIALGMAFLIVWWFYIELVLVNVMLFLILLLIIITINITYFLIQNRRNNDLMKISMYENHLGTIEELMTSIRSIQHDYNNHIQAIQATLYNINELNYEDAKSKISSYITDMGSEKEFIDMCKFDNIILAGLLFSKLREAKSKEIEMSLNIKDFNVATKLEDHDLITALGIIIDNAIDASGPNSTIYINIYREPEYCVFEVINNCKVINDKEFMQMFELGYSTKTGEKRGIGLRNLDQILRNNKGVKDYENKMIDGKNNLLLRLKLPKV